METNKYRHIQSGLEYEKYFSKPTGVNENIKRNSKLEDTVNFLPEAINRSRNQVKAFCNTIKSTDVEGICSELWHWLYTHIRYHKDDKGKEQIRSPRRSFYERERGIDCDDYTVFISSCLCHFKIPHVLRIAKYKEENGYQHIYPIVPIQNEEYITIDCVVDQYNYEVPPIQTIDKPMDLEFLDGIDNSMPLSEMNGIDAEDLLQGYEDMGELGKRLRDSKVATGIKNTFQKGEQSKVYNKIRKGVHAVNRVNPATALLRAGILASLKLNLLKVAEQLRFGYLSRDQAIAKGFDLDKYNRLVGVKNRLQKVFYGAGGKEENFKLAVLTGKGNANKEVMAGLGSIDNKTYSLDNDLSQILGIESYDSEMQGVEGIEGLGEPATGAAIAAATSVMTAIAGLLKGIGSLRNKQQGTGKDQSDQSNGINESASNDTPAFETPTSETTPTNTSQSNSTQDTSANAKDGADNSSGSNTTETPADTSNTTDANSSGTNSNEKGFPDNARGTVNTNAKGTDQPSLLAKGKEWVTKNPVAAGTITLVAIGLVTWAVVAYTKKKKKNKGEKKGEEISGLSKNKKHYSSHNYPSKHNQNIKIQKLK